MECTTERKPVFTLQVSEGEAAKGDERVDEVVIGVGPAFDKYQHKTLIDMPHKAILKSWWQVLKKRAACAGGENSAHLGRFFYGMGCGQSQWFRHWDWYPVEGNHGDSSARSAAAE